MTMISTSHKNFTASPGLATALHAVWRAILWPFAAIHARAELARLAELSDFELRDIGLSRQDLRDVSGLPLGADPTQRLAQTVAQTRRARRR